MAESKDISGIIYTPPQAARLTVGLVENLERTKDTGLPTGIADLDAPKNMTRMRPNDLIVVLGYTSNFKSGLMDFISKYNSKLINTEENEFIAKFTWEQSVEEDTIRWLASDTGISVTNLSQGILEPDQWTIIRKSANKRAQSPIWIIGHSQTEFARVGAARPRMTMTDAWRAMEMICGGKITNIKHKPRLVVLDYLQRIKPDPADGHTRREQQMEAVNKAKDLGVAFGCPVILGVQAGREVLERDNKLPTVDDGQETSNIEQSADKILSVWYPIKTEKPGTTISGEPVTPNLLIVGLLKQKNGPAPKTYACYIDPEKILVGSLPKKDGHK